MATYSDAVFRVRSVDEAKRIILTGESGQDTATRWTTETPYLVQRMRQCFSDDALLLDFGCGLGRLAKEWLEQCPRGHAHGCDFSLGVLQLAPACVANARFGATPPAQTRTLVAENTFIGVYRRQ
jgi:SAM-dependent methyltransferase